MDRFDRALGELTVLTIYAGTGPCTLCSCTGFKDDGAGVSRCKCGDRKMDHRDTENGEGRAREGELVRSA